MDKLPHRDPRIWEALEACRPGSDDLTDPGMADLAAEMALSPELREAYRRLQRWDSAMTEAFQDVPVPEGLEKRLLARLKAADAENAAIAAVVQSPREVSPVEPAQAVSSPRWHGSRRWWLALAGSAGLAASLFLVFFLVRVFNPSPAVPRELLLNEAIGRFNRDFDDGLWGTGKRLDRGAAEPADYPMSADLASSYPFLRWRAVKDLSGHEGLAYDFRDSQGIAATLYVFRGNGAGLPGGPPPSPHTTAGCAAGVWQADGLVYVLVVAGESGEYEQLLHPIGSNSVTA